MNTYAIIEAGGEQLQLEPGRFYDIRHLVLPIRGDKKQWIPNTGRTLGSPLNTKLLLYRVLMLRHQSTTLVGTPWVKNAIVKGRILHTRRNEKVTVYKMHPKKKTRRKNGHRQELARFVVDGIFLGNKQL
jgi:large subunit ribosomal protein L21